MSHSIPVPLRFLEPSFCLAHSKAHLKSGSTRHVLFPDYSGKEINEAGVCLPIRTLQYVSFNRIINNVNSLGIYCNVTFFLKSSKFDEYLLKHARVWREATIVRRRGSRKAGYTTCDVISFIYLVIFFFFGQQE